MNKRSICVAIFLVFSLGLIGCAAEPTLSPVISTATTTATLTANQTQLIVTPTQTFTASPTISLPSATPAEITEVRFAVIGDFGTAGEPLRIVADMVIGWEPDFIITTGDNNYTDGEAETIDENIGQYFHQFIFPYLGEYGEGAQVNRFFPTLGNHDWNTTNAQPHLDYFTLPGNERYYDFVWGPVHLFAIDSDSREPDGIGRSSIQAAWLRDALAASTSPWKIVYMHQPPYSSGDHGSQLALQWPYREWGATIVLGGHDHDYERLEIDGFPYIVNGVGGSGYLYDFWEIVPGSLVRYTRWMGLCWWMFHQTKSSSNL